MCSKLLRIVLTLKQTYFLTELTQLGIPSMFELQQLSWLKDSKEALMSRSKVMTRINVTHLFQGLPVIPSPY